MIFKNGVKSFSDLKNSFTARKGYVTINITKKKGAKRMAQIKCVCISTRRKSSAVNVHQCQATFKGLEGDIHFGMGEKQVSLLPMEQVGKYFAARGEDILYGRFGENLVVEGLEWDGLHEGDRLRAGAVLLEIVRIGAGGPASDAYQGEKVCSPMEEFFVFCKILTEGMLQEEAVIREEKK